MGHSMLRASKHLILPIHPGMSEDLTESVAEQQLTSLNSHPSPPYLKRDAQTWKKSPYLKNEQSDDLTIPNQKEKGIMQSNTLHLNCQKQPCINHMSDRRACANFYQCWRCSLPIPTLACLLQIPVRRSPAESKETFQKETNTREIFILHPKEWFTK